MLLVFDGTKNMFLIFFVGEQVATASKNCKLSIHCVWYSYIEHLLEKGFQQRDWKFSSERWFPAHETVEPGGTTSCIEGWGTKFWDVDAREKKLHKYWPKNSVKRWGLIGIQVWLIDTPAYGNILWCFELLFWELPNSDGFRIRKWIFQHVQSGSGDVELTMSLGEYMMNHSRHKCKGSNVARKQQFCRFLSFHIISYSLCFLKINGRKKQHFEFPPFFWFSLETMLT